MNGIHRRRLVAALSLAAAGLAATAAAAAAAPSVAVSPTVNLTPAGKTVTVSGSEIPLTTGTPAGTGLYAAEFAIVDGTTYVANNATAKFVRTNPSSSAAQAKLNDDGTYSTTVNAVQAWGSVDCLAANTQCFVGSWPAHGNPSAANIIDAKQIQFADIAATPAAPLKPTGQAVAVTGTNLSLTTGTPPGTGLYAAEFAIVDGTTYRANNASAKFVFTGGTDTASTAELKPDGSFATSITPVSSWGSGATAVDCAAANTECFIGSWPAHGNPSAANVIDAKPLTFVAGTSDPGTGGGGGGGTGTPSVAVSPTSGLSTTGPTAVTVSGSGFSPTANGGIGVYVMYGPLTATQQSQFFSAKWVAPGNAASADTDVMSSSGTFSTSVNVVPSYTDGTGAFVNCTVVQCAIRTIAAHGSADRSQDTTTLISFGGAVATQADTPVTTPSLVPDAPSTSATPNAAPDTTSAAVPSVGKPVVKNGKASLKVSEASTVTFVLRKKVGKRWVTVKTVEVKTTKAGTVSAKLPMGKAGTYRVSVRAVSSKTGKASRTVTKTTTIKAKASATKRNAKRS